VDAKIVTSYQRAAVPADEMATFRQRPRFLQIAAQLQVDTKQQRIVPVFDAPRAATAGTTIGTLTAFTSHAQLKHGFGAAADGSAIFEQQAIESFMLLRLIQMGIEHMSCGDCFSCGRILHRLAVHTISWISLRQTQIEAHSTCDCAQKAYHAYYLETSCKTIFVQGEACMEKEMLPIETGHPQPHEIEPWDDDCGLSDLARDAFAQLQQPSEPEKDPPE
jgi:hypothetical protein